MKYSLEERIRYYEQRIAHAQRRLKQLNQKKLEMALDQLYRNLEEEIKRERLPIRSSNAPKKAK